MSGIVLFLILHISTCTKDTNSSKIILSQLDTYSLAKYAFFAELVPLQHMYICVELEIELGIEQYHSVYKKLAVQKACLINILGNNKGVNTRHKIDCTHYFR